MNMTSHWSIISAVQEKFPDVNILGSDVIRHTTNEAGFLFRMVLSRETFNPLGFYEEFMTDDDEAKWIEELLKKIGMCLGEGE
jgi:hypothetical protein